eukprot:GHRR01004316.1.p1 GENE.GHRR01004316.1~~GHRR01004316.1.p1  ORF type:complete len:244 (+),score=74.28 GHRR01004316.1:131-862(+)
MTNPIMRLETNSSSLELDIWHNPGVAGTRGVVMLHPWSKLGGSMMDPIIIHAYRAAVASGLFNTVCRYNMRGAGASQAKWTKNLWDPDVQDMVAVCQYILSQVADPPTELYVIGYSYGACVAANSMELVPQIVGYIAISFPLGGMANLALRSRQHWSQLALSSVPKLVVQGSKDKFSALSTLREYTAMYHAYEPTPGPLDLQIVDGADHFFDGQWQEVAEKVMAWVQKQVGKQAAGTPGAAAV